MRPIFIIISAVIIVMAFNLFSQSAQIALLERGERMTELNAVQHGCAVVKDGKIEWRGEGK